ncbi:MAG: hypothetical protein O3C40_15095 [Planctomycetota bacterium]|nr:hypothetical protein [Planctomycetota bacterium]
MSRMFLRVAKVGGSLFDFADLPTALRCWLDSQPGVNVLIAGGGPFADEVRQADATFALGDAASHRLSLEAMRVSAELLAGLLHETEVLHSLDDVRERLVSRGVVVLDPWETLTLPECRLPHSWSVTSDSIAAYVASQLQARELVLFKSTPLPANTNRVEAAESGLVDGYFVHAATTFPTVRWVNLRGTPVTERPLR